MLSLPLVCLVVSVVSSSFWPQRPSLGLGREGLGFLGVWTVGLALPAWRAWAMVMPGAPASACWGPREDARSSRASTFLVTASLALAGMRAKAAATSSSRVVALSSRFLRFLADRTVLAMSLPRRVVQG